MRRLSDTPPRARGDVELTLATVKRRFTNSGDRWAFEGCDSPLFDGTGAWLVSSATSSERAQAVRDMTPDGERKTYNNLLIMCANHARVIDHRENVTRFPPDLLREWKTRQEAGPRVTATDAAADALLGRSAAIIARRYASRPAPDATRSPLLMRT